MDQASSDICGSNGYGYHSISDYMIEQGYITENTLWPQHKIVYSTTPELAHYFKQNPSYVFSNLSLILYTGAITTPLKEYISIAIDQKYYSFNSLFFYRLNYLLKHHNSI